MKRGSRAVAETVLARASAAAAPLSGRRRLDVRCCGRGQQGTTTGLLLVGTPRRVSRPMHTRARSPNDVAAAAASSRAFSSSSSSSSTTAASFGGALPSEKKDPQRQHAPNDGRTTKSTTRKAAAVPLALYRQLLKWCHAPSRAGVPLSSIVPPVVHLRAPEQLDSERWRRIVRAVTVVGAGGGNEDGLAAADAEVKMTDPALGQALRLLLWQEDPDENTRGAAAALSSSFSSQPCWGIVDEQSFTAPVHSSLDLARFFRVAFRVNSGSGTGTNQTEPSAESVQHQKQRVSAAFEALRSLNEIDAALDAMRARRALHENELRNNNRKIGYRVGHVVQHREKRWRGVVVGWEVVEEEGAARKATSLTSKEYLPVDNASATTSRDSTIRYHVVLDDGEAHMRGVSSPGQTFANQDELVRVVDPDLLRIRSRTVSEYFVAFDRARGAFVPNETLRFEYALDMDEDSGALPSPPRLSDSDAELCHAVIQDCKHLAASLKDMIADDAAQSQLLAKVQDRVDRLLEGNVLPMGVRFATPRGPALSTVAAHYVRAWHGWQHEVMEIAFSRQSALESRHRARFRLGDVVRHRLYGYRGVVVGWDPKPAMDVSGWDGLQRVDDPTSHPFYHVVPDPGDSIEAFGEERPFRYVCQENLEDCPPDRRRIDADLEPQDWTWDPATGRYEPSDALRFKYAEDRGDEDAATERGMSKVQEAVNRWQYESRIATSDEGSSPLSVHKLLRLLQIVDNTPDSIAVQEAIKENRKAHPRLDLRRRLEDGVGELMLGNGDEAVAIYTSIVEQDPDSYPEVHNRIATCQFMMGRIDEALEATLKTLEMDPFHVQALNGLGLIHFDRKEYGQAIDAFRKSISIDPWSPVTAKLSVSIDLVNQTPHDEGEEVSR